MLPVPICCSFLTWFGHDSPAGQFVCPQFPYRGNDTIFWIFPIVPCHAFCMWHWPIGKDLDLSFIWGHHHLHLVGLWISVNPGSQPAAYFTACFTVLKRPNKVETAVHGCNLAFSLDSIVSLPLLSFRCSISLASLFTSLIKGSLSSSWMNSPIQVYFCPSGKTSLCAKLLIWKYDVTCTVIRMNIKWF